MKNISVKIAAALASVVATAALADVKTIEGSDTMYGLVNDAIVQAGLDGEISYVGGGSGKGETALVEGRQGIAALSRAMKDDAVAKAKTAGINVTPHKVAVDAVAIWVNKNNASSKIDVNSLRSIFSCRAGDWKDDSSSTPEDTRARALSRSRRGAAARPRRRAGPT